MMKSVYNRRSPLSYRASLRQIAQHTATGFGSVVVSNSSLSCNV